MSSVEGNEEGARHDEGVLHSNRSWCRMGAIHPFPLNGSCRTGTIHPFSTNRPWHRTG